MEREELLNQVLVKSSAFTAQENLIIAAGLLFILAWLVLCVFWAKTMLQKFTFNPESNPYKTETLGLPRGSIRGLLTLTLLVVVIVMICMSLLVESFRGVFDSLINAFQVMLAFYFGSKVMHHVTSADRTKTVSKASAEVETAIAKSKFNPSTVADESVG
jgi:hypothetical protein